jgi:2-polyprenyl-3-methyl-5-hydroxy-6-metoxy-1,4-benzoquinol methylase
VHIVDDNRDLFERELRDDGYLPIHRPKYEAVIRELLPLRATTLLDVGALNGAGTLSLRDGLGLQSSNVFATDVFTEAVEACGRRGLQALLWPPNEPFPLQGKTFEIITLLDVIEHVVDTDELLMTLRGLLSDGGRLVLTTPNLAYWWSRVRLMFGKIPIYGPSPSPHHVFDLSSHPGHLRVLPTGSWIPFFPALGLRIRSIFGYHEAPSSFTGLRHRLMQWIDERSSHFPGIAKGVGFVLERS